MRRVLCLLLLCFLLVRTSPARADITTGLVLWLELSAGSGTTAVDSATGNGAQNATLPGAPSTPTWITSGCRPGGCLSFDGTNDYISGSPVGATTAFTVTVWVNPTLITGSNREIYTSANDIYTLRLDPNPKFFVNVGGAYTSCTHTTGLSLSTWTHLAGTWDGSNIRLYINGVLSSASPCAKTGTTGATGNYIIGIHNGFVANPFNGQIDSVRVYTRGLTASDVAEDMALGTPTAAAPRRIVIY